ncbi:MAG: 3-deoxy-7-phosphoheptulonate synthase class II [Myxococcota bacterium]|nr:3-deoxy-7-phosphoheptulonate synthase class II [Myxococcota bacterium]
MKSWNPHRWRGLPIRQQPVYDDPDAAERALGALAALPPLVHPGEIATLRKQLAEAGAGQRFLLQGGDCAERFVDCTAAAIEAKLRILLQMSVVLTWGGQTPVVRVARLAGQFAKPRSSATEPFEGREVLTYRGDHINGIAPSERDPDPGRLLQAYHHSATTLNYVRALLDGGFADLHQAGAWDLGFVRDETRRSSYEGMVQRMLEAVHFVEAIGAPSIEAFNSVRLFTSHEGLLLPYESALTRQAGSQWLNLGAHFLWIGDRTRQLDGAHVDYFRGIGNPIGVKVGPSMAPPELVEVVRALNPDNEPGKLTLITRYGAKRVQELLPSHIAAVQGAGLQVVWSCDPMHGNTRKTSVGLKTRDFDDILAELRAAFDVHATQKTVLGGVHFEMTGDDVTECTGGPQGLGESDLSRAYESFCDPRLNSAQSLEVAFLVARRLQQERSGATRAASTGSR